MEMLIVVAILAMALAVMAARGPLMSRGLEAQAAASRLAQTLRLGRTRAIAANRPVPVALDLSTHGVALDGVQQFVLPVSATVTARMADGSLPRRRAQFVFTPDGSATGGSVVLAVGERRLMVTVDWLTGHVGIAGP